MNNVNYEKVNVVKAIIQNPDGQILLIQEPEMNEWMPGRWGLPGGRPAEKESVKNAFYRKMVEETGMKLEPAGIYKIEELLINERTVLMFIVVANVDEVFKPTGTSTNHKWVGKEDVEKMDIVDFTEYYNKSMLLAYFDNGHGLIDFEIFDTRDYHIFSGDSEYRRWYETNNPASKPHGHRKNDK